MITVFGTFPVTMNPAMETFSPPRTRARVEIFARRDPALRIPSVEVKEMPCGSAKVRAAVFMKLDAAGRSPRASA